MSEIEEIWASDLLDRRSEAERLIRFMESAYARTSQREDASAYVLAVDGEYGQGKSFFLRRLAEQLALGHPVAFVDAWADDIADEPFIALTATLRTALASHLKKPSVSERWADFTSKAGMVVKLTAVGVLKRGATLALTAGVADQVSEVISGASETVKEAVAEASTEIAGTAVDDSLQGLRSIAPSKLLDREIDAFEQRKLAVSAMKQSLRALIESLRESSSPPPIFIVIDELDRCRPTYAVKLLEEVKHLFDVEGLVFVFGLHGGQLAHSVVGAYGPGFDGMGYLRRFFHRRFSLSEAPMGKLVNKLVADAQLQQGKFFNLKIKAGEGSPYDVSISELIGRYMELFGLSARDAFEVVDRLIVCTGLSIKPLNTLLLLPMICNEIKGKDALSTQMNTKPHSWTIPTYDTEGHVTYRSPVYMYESIAHALSQTKQVLDRQMRSDGVDLGVRMVWEQYNTACEFDRLQNYTKLLRTVDQFRNPALEEVATDGG